MRNTSSIFLLSFSLKEKKIPAKEKGIRMEKGKPNIKKGSFADFGIFNSTLQMRILSIFEYLLKK